MNLLTILILKSDLINQKVKYIISIFYFLWHLNSNLLLYVNYVQNIQIKFKLNLLLEGSRTRIISERFG
jgi:hypothetical protein